MPVEGGGGGGGGGSGKHEDIGFCPIQTKDFSVMNFQRVFTTTKESVINYPTCN